MYSNLTKKHFDLIVIGAGGAGLSTALSANKNGVNNIAVVSKVFVYSSHTVAAKGGINAPLGNVVKDSWRWHAFDTIKGSDFLADVNMVEILSKNANKAIIDLEKIGVVFSRDKKGKIQQRQYGGQMSDYGNGNLAYRACYSKDETGHIMLHSMYQQLMKRDINFLSEYFIVDLIFAKNSCIGCLALDLNQGQLVLLQAKNIVIACGGYSQIYKNTTSSKICSGDLLAYCFDNNLPLQDMEFIQFHPTGMANLGFLISEAARGEGAYLLNSKHERFMKDYEPKMMELASRDKISQAIATQIHENKGCGDNKNSVYLDLRHLSDDVLQNKIPGVVEAITKFLRLDVKKDLIEVAPSAHYTMGGLMVNEKCQILDKDNNIVDGLYAVGEAACMSVHGANRLGCNSLLDLVVFGEICGENIAKTDRKCDFCENNDEINEKITKFYEIFDENVKNSISLVQIREKIKENNEKYLGVFRQEQLMRQGLKNLFGYLREFEKYKINNSSLFFNDEIIDYFEVKSLLLNSIATYFSAINRKESRGAHFRKDYLQKNAKFLAHSVVFKNNNQRITENDLVFTLKDVNSLGSDEELNYQIQNYLKNEI